MRIKRSTLRFLNLLIVPALATASVGYFGTYTIWGERGLFTLEETNASLGVAQRQLKAITRDRVRLAHRVELMDKGDSDLVEELARIHLMEGAPNQVALRRDAP